MIQSETLELLEWPRLCQHLSTFAATKLGAIVARNLPIPETQTESELLLAQTKEVYELESRLHPGLSFEGIQDIGDSLERAALQSILPGEELLAIATTLAGTRNLRRVIDNQENIPVLNDLVSELRTYPELEQEIHRCIDERGQVTDRASQKMGEIRGELRKIRSQITQKLQNIIQAKSGAVQEQLITQRSDRFVIPVKAPQKDAIPGIVHDTSTSGATLYIEPNSIVPLGNQLRQIVRKEQAEAEAIRRTLTEKVAEVTPDLERLLVIVTTLDLAVAKSRYSFWIGANPPRFVNRDEIITLRNLRHPLLVWQQQHEQGNSVVPVDLLISPQIRVVTITGPNTGGKTVTLKTLGLAAVMAKVGLFVPAREPVEMPWFSQILADIGDEQSLQQSLSTFSGHIRRISRILEALEPGENDLSPLVIKYQSLVLLDEVGAGTDPAEGSALAIALLKYLSNHSQLTMASTHFGELKALKYEDHRFENASVEFDETTLSPTYRLLWGIPGRSNALSIALRLGLNPEIVAEAKTQVGEATDEVNQVIAGLEAQRRNQETKAAEAQKLLRQAERLYKEVSDKATALEAREKDLRVSQEIAVQQAITQAKGEIAQVIRRLQQGTANAQDAQQATANLNQIAQKYEPTPPPKSKPGFMPKLGDRVRIPKLGQTAEVLTIPDVDGNFTVRFGIMKMTVQLQDIESLDGQKPEPMVKAKPAPSVVTLPPAPAIRTSKNTIDLRGKRVADAEYILDKAISEAAGPLWIIHGHGTGKLKLGVHAFLQQHPRVTHYEPAEQADGGSGVTIAHI
ncbi:MAG: endonuclease MutS2 [Aphanizomenon sp.]|mgnify:CR=1 FL=1|uniref:Endonuclease MutS2 n=2 Tax=Aphanizomenon flos-aquae TaxID=1176 RepID=A0A1B7X7K7_APHFL|nr:endonuclease MutS2 [Aphanizomenon flos-aquae Clear-A1]MBO1044656.1 endonuclease MutS2 [Aphanizomenon flos-aquae UKL13-PB]MBO1060841.1 endonuclease MutS2 [Aphanizomenon flos-aquae CP01]OBQ22879.1 MAG: DNA mismatch repair protein MutS [Anabaena sp. WA113]OBQ27292.1 MAG: DNA mismatch repair protein MutS [Aphanizomenon flos-aquae LD13]OBQ45369.1 MAG: DNA mismatch repair protein MutS [Aphanizomenon flos-aquae WA102]QSV67645.1 MAG: endonuclease MutS2 [Aphanizomenon flos-aquae DEX188]HCQ21891.1 